MYLIPTDCREISNIIKLLKVSSQGWDDISSKVVKSTSVLFNLSLQQGVFPSQLKIAKVIPLFKDGDKSLVNNYRPVSLLPLFSKILEQILYSRLIDFVNRQDLLYKYQFGFREKQSVNTDLIILMAKILNAALIR